MSKGSGDYGPATIAAVTAVQQQADITTYPGQVDAAPCGSGTCARLALFHHRGLMEVGSTFVSRGLLGLHFTARIGGLTQVEGRPAILPEITGTAYLTGFSQQLFDPGDPMRAGYLLDV